MFFESFNHYYPLLLISFPAITFNLIFDEPKHFYLIIIIIIVNLQRATEAICLT